MAERKKAPYTTSQKSRFVISDDPYSQERFAAVKTAVQVIQEMCPAVVDGVLLGSLSKGKVLTAQTASQTDIDLVMMVEPDKMASVQDGLMVKVPYAPALKNALRYRFPSTNEAGLDQLAYTTFVRTHAKSLIAANIKDKNNKAGVETSSIITKPIASEGQYSIYEETKDVFNGAKDWTEHRQRLAKKMNQILIGNVALFWGWDLNGGLMPFRETFFKQLASLGDELRETNWQAIDNYIRYWERKYQISPQLEKFYPKTFEEAVKYYITS